VKRQSLLTGVLLGMSFALAPVVSAHERVQAVVRFEPVRPVVATSSTVHVRFETTTGVPQDMTGHEIRVIAEMTGHAMRPVEATLTPTGERGQYRGDLEFTMAGPWRVSVRVDGGHEPVTGAVTIAVALEPEAAVATDADAAGTVVALDMDVPESDRGYSPWVVLIGAIALVLWIEGLAIVRKLSEGRRRGRADVPRFGRPAGLDADSARARGKV
jgi:hypothetical protein